MQDTTIIFLGAATVINSISVVLATALKKQTDTLKKIEGKVMSIFLDVGKHKAFANQCFKNFCYVKDGFRKVRVELIKQNILTHDFKDLDEDEATEAFIEKFIKGEPK